jgi:aspartyl-tRNA(Asn)/glutamyl-tRNA(Gln) amidotransferase subunit B
MDYELVIGLEVHAELSTKSKIYCTCTTDFGGEPNTHCCPICIGMPGVLPVLNKKVVEYAVRAGIATNCSISDYSKQDRKSYFYPDLPKAYQTSQFDLPLCLNGYVDIIDNGETKRIGLTRIHIEEDAGKLIHDDRGGGTILDFNRCGVPLIEIVGEPDLRSAEETKIYIETLKSILEYIDVSDCKMEEGSLRADVNISLRPRGQKEYGTRTELKNLNSIKAIVKAIEFESKRQERLLESGGIVVQETRRWDDIKGITYSMRSKEEAHDYRYFPEPDLAPIVVDKNWLEAINSTLPELPSARKKKYIDKYGLPEYDAAILTSTIQLSDFFEEAVENSKNPKAISNWVMGDLMKILKEKEIEPSKIPFKGGNLAKMINMIDEGKISGTIAKKVFEKMFESGKSPDEIVKDEGLEVVSDEEELIAVVKDIIDQNPQSVADFKAGKEKAIGFLMGQAMKATKGKANPQVIGKILREELNQRQDA